MKNHISWLTKTQWFTIAGILFYLLWEYLILAEWKATTHGPLIRIDLLFIYPAILIGTILSLIQVYKRNKAVGYAIFGFILGGILVSTVIFQQMSNRYDLGYNNGYLRGQFDVSYFLQDHLDGKSVEPYSIKYFSLHPKEIEGIKTFEIIGLDD